ncbi:hypothetical protein Rsub_11549 [Raphidocelis subcapitata]|uniref:Uncharacterized protein n=1 Tax=Raphidocelis subcapitata TaxID=307507 RepID=A0A2V0PM17_9CHLO|nr:hypothetical protein Rsub_11549 [Raphidocelis subcapitata]|eukprot:GBF98910.1 hypothetical protein Rsub_11549 [Raphidocelis subcapitata]
MIKLDASTGLVASPPSLGGHAIFLMQPPPSTAAQPRLDGRPSARPSLPRPAGRRARFAAAMQLRRVTPQPRLAGLALAAQPPRSAAAPQPRLAGLALAAQPPRSAAAPQPRLAGLALAAQPATTAAAPPPAPTTTHHGRCSILDGLYRALVQHNNPGSPSPSIRGTSNSTPNEGLVIEADAVQATFEAGQALLDAGRDREAAALPPLEAAAMLVALHLGTVMACFGGACGDGGAPTPVFGAARAYPEGTVKRFHAHGSDRASDADLQWRRCLVLVRFAEEPLSAVTFRGGSLGSPTSVMQPFGTVCVCSSKLQGEGLDRALGRPGETSVSQLRWEHAVGVVDPATGSLVGSDGRVLTLMMYMNDAHNGLQLPRRVAQQWQLAMGDPELRARFARLEAAVASGFAAVPRAPWVSGGREASMSAKARKTASSSLAERIAAAGGAGANSAVSSHRFVIQAGQDVAELDMPDCDRCGDSPSREEYMRHAVERAKQQLAALRRTGRYVAGLRRRELGAAGAQRLISWPADRLHRGLEAVACLEKPAASSHHLPLAGSELAAELRLLLASEQLQAYRHAWAGGQRADGSWGGSGTANWSLAWLHNACDEFALSICNRVTNGAVGCGAATAALICLSKIGRCLDRSARLVDAGLRPFAFTSNKVRRLALTDLPAARKLQEQDIRITATAAGLHMPVAQFRQLLALQGASYDEWRAAERERKAAERTAQREREAAERAAAAAERAAQREREAAERAAAAAERKAAERERKAAERAAAAAERAAQREPEAAERAAAAAERKAAERERKAAERAAAAAERKAAERERDAAAAGGSLVLAPLPPPLLVNLWHPLLVTTRLPASIDEPPPPRGARLEPGQHAGDAAFLWRREQLMRDRGDSDAAIAAQLAALQQTLDRKNAAAAWPRRPWGTAQTAVPPSVTFRTLAEFGRLRTIGDLLAVLDALDSLAAAPAAADRQHRYLSEVLPRIVPPLSPGAAFFTDRAFAHSYLMWLERALPPDWLAEAKAAAHRVAAGQLAATAP